MRSVQLLKLKTYHGYGLKVTQDNPSVTVDDEIAAGLVASGHFQYIGPAPVPIIEFAIEEALELELEPETDSNSESLLEEKSTPEPSNTKKKGGR